MTEPKLVASVEKRFERALKKFGLVEHSDSLRQQVQICYSISRGQGKRVRIGGSHFGGRPHMPPEIQWPMDGDGLMTFVAQIDLKDIADNPFGLASGGWLLYFIGRAEATGAPNQVFCIEGDASLEKIEPPPGGGFVNDAYPIGETSEGLFPETPIKIKPGATLPEIVYDSPIYDELDDLKTEFRMSHSRLFGHMSDDGAQIDDNTF